LTTGSRSRAAILFHCRPSRSGSAPDGVASVSSGGGAFSEIQNADSPSVDHLRLSIPGSNRSITAREAARRSCTDWVPRKVALDAEQRAGLPETLRRWLRFALERRGVASEWIEPVVAEVDASLPEFEAAYDDESSWGPAKAVAAELAKRDVDLTRPGGRRRRDPCAQRRTAGPAAHPGVSCPPTRRRNRGGALELSGVCSLSEEVRPQARRAAQATSAGSGRGTGPRQATDRRIS